MRNEALNVDCMEYMAALPDKYFDLAVVDPPYGDGNGGYALHLRNPQEQQELSEKNGRDSATGSTVTRRIPRTGIRGKQWGVNPSPEPAARGRQSTVKK